jgi:hypothetical protein
VLQAIIGDFYGDNGLGATREPWLAIDPKPLVGERDLSLAPIKRGYEFGHRRTDVVYRLDNLQQHGQKGTWQAIPYAER